MSQIWYESLLTLKHIVFFLTNTNWSVCTGLCCIVVRVVNGLTVWEYVILSFKGKKISCFLLYYSPVWRCGEVSNVTYQGGENSPTAASLQWLFGKHQNDFAGPLWLLSRGTHWSHHAAGKPVVSLILVLLNYVWNCRWFQVNSFVLKQNTKGPFVHFVFVSRFDTCFISFVLFHAYYDHFFLLPFFSLFTTVGTMERSAEQTQSPCSGSVRRPATWWGTARPARMTTPSPSSMNNTPSSFKTRHKQYHIHTCTSWLGERVIATGSCF